MNTRNWQSNVLWPNDVCHNEYGTDISTDIHLSRDAAMGVCRALHMEGFAGKGEVFPIASWISEPQGTDNPRLPMTIPLLLNFWKAHNLLHSVGRSGPNKFFEADYWVSDTVTPPRHERDVTQRMPGFYMNDTSISFDYLVGVGLPAPELLRYLVTGIWMDEDTLPDDISQLPHRSFFGVFMSFLANLRVAVDKTVNEGTNPRSGVLVESVLGEARLKAIQGKVHDGNRVDLENFVNRFCSTFPAPAGGPDLATAEYALESTQKEMDSLRNRVASAEARANLWEWAAQAHRDQVIRIVSEKPPTDWMDSLTALKEVVTGSEEGSLLTSNKRLGDLKSAISVVISEVRNRDFSCMSQRCKIVPGVSCCKDSLTNAIQDAERLLKQ